MQIQMLQNLATDLGPVLALFFSFKRKRKAGKQIDRVFLQEKFYEICLAARPLV